MAKSRKIHSSEDRAVREPSPDNGLARLKDNRSEIAAQRKVQQGMANSPRNEATAQLRSIMQEGPADQAAPIQRKSNRTGLPDQLKSGVENLSGFAMDDVKVHYNSSKPAQLQAHAYAQGRDIHLAPGQEKHLPHEAWHVVQQKQGRVKPTRQFKGKVSINDDAGLEKEADEMGAKALQRVALRPGKELEGRPSDTIQRKGNDDEFAKPKVNEHFNPKAEAGETDGIRLVPEADKRPDDVPEVPEYRKAVNRMHNVLMALKQKGKMDQYEHFLDIFLNLQAQGKKLAKGYKISARNLGKEVMFEPMQEEYVIDMMDLTVLLNGHAEEAMEANSITESQLGLQDRHWRIVWLKILSTVQSVLSARWPYWKKTIKTAMRGLYGWEDNANPAAQRRLEWINAIGTQSWKLFFGGSLAKGYKGPPKQNVRFQSERFDIDANMDAPAVAEYLINGKGRKVDRGQLAIDPNADQETKIPEMDKDIDGHIKFQLVEKKIVTEEEVELIISEPFETRVNATVANQSAQEEVQRASSEQALRDRITGIAKSSMANMEFIREMLKLNGDDYLMDIDGKLVLTDRPLEMHEIQWMNGVIDFVEGKDL